jgi:hypothetical protein
MGIRTVITAGTTPDTTGRRESNILIIEDKHYTPYPNFDYQLPDQGAACSNPNALNSQRFDNGVIGCYGKETWGARNSLCAPGSRACTAAEFKAARGGRVPTHDYWTDDNLRFSGAASACSVSTTTGSQCTSGQPMRVCTPNGADPEGNACAWTNCGLGTNTPNEYFGGCSGASNATAGTLCCLSVP